MGNGGGWKPTHPALATAFFEMERVSGPAEGALRGRRRDRFVTTGQTSALAFRQRHLF